MAGEARPVLAVTGLLAEARIAAGPGVETLAGGGIAARLTDLLERCASGRIAGVISFGIAGGLAPELPAGAVVIGGGVEDGETRWPADPHWRRALLASLPHAVCGDLAGVDAAVAGAAGKAALHARTGALAVDMESHVAARFAARHNLPFAMLRVIADPAQRSLPRAALVGMKADGTADVPAVLRALAQRPGDLPGLIRTALDARAAFASLKASRLLLGAGLGPVGLPLSSDSLGEAVAGTRALVEPVAAVPEAASA